MSAFHRPVLLVADDEPDILELLVVLLEQQGYRVMSAINGQAAIEVALQYEIELAVLDVSMPLLNGLTAGTVIRQAKPGMPLVFHTALPEEYVRQRFAGPSGYLLKPSEPPQIIAAVKDGLSSLGLG